ncbi:MAG: TRAP transporter small permease [Oscillospiraceae bacterium]|nr:TRAP transporter small permease [Oscillospiraceae bacterium]
MQKVRNAISFISDKLSYVAMVVIFALTCMTTVDVVMRKVSSSNIVGSYEITELGMLVAIWIAIGFYQISKGHIRVTMFIDKMPPRGRMAMEILCNLIGTVMMALCIYGGILRVGSDVAKELATTVLHIPQAPFTVIMVIGEVIFFLLLLVDLIVSVIDIITYKKDDGNSDVKIDDVPDINNLTF